MFEVIVSLLVTISVIAGIFIGFARGQSKYFIKPGGYLYQTDTKWVGIGIQLAGITIAIAVMVFVDQGIYRAPFVSCVLAFVGGWIYGAIGAHAGLIGLYLYLRDEEASGS